MDFREFIEDISPAPSFGSAPSSSRRSGNKLSLVPSRYKVSYILNHGERDIDDFDDRDSAMETFKGTIKRLPLGAIGVKLSFGNNVIEEYRISPNEYSVYLMYDEKRGVRVAFGKDEAEINRVYEFRKKEPTLFQKSIRLYKGTDLIDSQ